MVCARTPAPGTGEAKGQLTAWRRITVASVALAALACGPGAHRPDPPPAAATLPLRARLPRERFEGDLLAVLRAADPGERMTALVDLTDQLDVRAFVRAHRRAWHGKAERRQAVITALEAVATRQQARIRPVLDAAIAGGALASARYVAIVNRIVVAGHPAALLALADNPEVAILRPDWTSEHGSSLAASSTEPPSDGRFTSWAIDAMKAPSLWRAGLDGAGTVVASIDTGAFEAHEQLRDRRLPGARGWFDPVESTVAATDRHGHGTAVLSCAVGGNPDGRLVGIAPGAHWSAALGNWKDFYSRSRMTLSADWALRVARPDVLVNAWSHDEGECNAFDLPFIDAWKASGIFVVFPAGNGGPAGASGDTPAQLRGVFPEGGPVFSVAALAQGGNAHTRSSRGPSRCGSPAFPTVSAPGVDLPIAALGSPRSYAHGEGTSLSAGLVGGAAALLLQAVPETDPETLERVLVQSARDVAPPGRDDATGAGAIDLEAALKLLREGR